MIRPHKRFIQQLNGIKNEFIEWMNELFTSADSWRWRFIPAAWIRYCCIHILHINRKSIDNATQAKPQYYIVFYVEIGGLGILFNVRNTLK